MENPIKSLCDTFYRAEHAWSIVRIEGKWQLLDLTYASGYIGEVKGTT